MNEADSGYRDRFEDASDAMREFKDIAPEYGDLKKKGAIARALTNAHIVQKFAQLPYTQRFLEVRDQRALHFGIEILDAGRRKNQLVLVVDGNGFNIMRWIPCYGWRWNEHPKGLFLGGEIIRAADSTDLNEEVLTNMWDVKFPVQTYIGKHYDLDTARQSFPQFSVILDKRTGAITRTFVVRFAQLKPDEIIKRFQEGIKNPIEFRHFLDGPG